MHKPLIVCAISSTLLFSALAQSAEDYTTFLSASYSSIDSTVSASSASVQADNDSWQLSASHYFAPRPTMGPLKEFQYINQQSFITASAQFADETDNQALGGELIWNDWAISASSSFGDADTTSVGVGYFITQDFKISVYNTSYDDAGGLFDSDDSIFNIGADYVYPLADKSYIGASFSTDEDMSASTLNTKYFNDLGNDYYISVSAAAVVYGDELDYVEDTISLGAEFYFSQYTSVSVGGLVKGETDGFNIGASHYFDENSSLRASYSDYETELNYGFEQAKADTKIWSVVYQYQFSI